MDRIAKHGDKIVLPQSFREKLEEAGVDFDAVVLPDWYETVELRRCEVCGVDYPDFAEENADRCRCYRAKAVNLKAIEDIDPYETMTLRSLRGADGGLARSIGIVANVINRDRKRGLIMVGPPGNGKTHVLVGACREALAVGKVAIWQNFASLVSRIQGSYSDHEGPSRNQIIENIANHEVVILDDIGKEKDSEDVATITYELIDLLYRRRRTVLAASNLNELEIARRYDRAVADRLRHMCEFVPVTGESRRGSVDY